MKYIWLIALGVLLLFGVVPALRFLEFAFFAALIFTEVSAIYLTIGNLIRLKLWKALCYGCTAWFFGWILSLCI